jgi:hypothetical protein
MIYINNTHKQGQPITVIENKNAHIVQNKEKEMNMRQEKETKRKKLDTIQVKNNERISLVLPCGTKLSVFVGEECSIIDVSHYGTKATDQVQVKSCGFEFSEKSDSDLTWTHAKTQFTRSRDSSSVIVSHLAFNE